MTAKKCIIIHGCPSDVEKAMNPEKRTYDKHWIPWIKKELEKREIKTETPLMPLPWEPDYKAWKKEFETYNINENSDKKLWNNDTFIQNSKIIFASKNLFAFDWIFNKSLSLI